MKTTPLVLCLLVLGGCASQPTSLYGWGHYEPSVYSYFKNESPEKQITLLEKDRTDFQKTGAKAPPGFYAHLGLLYGKAGQVTTMNEMLAKEVDLYPESAQFINNVKTNFKKIK